MYWRRVRRLCVGAVIAMTLAACDERYDDYHFLMEFDAVIEGEAFAFESKLACKAKKAGTGTPFRSITYFGLDRISFGKRLKSGKGVFVAAPEVCKSYFDRDWDDGKLLTVAWNRDAPTQAVLPIIYVTDDYENPTHLRLYANPNGPEPATGVELRKSILRPLTKSEAEAAPERPKDEHDPFHISKEPSWTGHVFLRFADDVVSKVDPGELLLETERYRLYRQEAAIWEQTPYIYASKYWSSLWRAAPLNDAIDNHKSLREGERKEREAGHNAMARKGFADSISTVLVGKTLEIDLENRGVIDAYKYGFYKRMILNKEDLKLALEGQTTEFSGFPKFFEGLILQDLSSGQMYQMTRLLFRVHI